MSEIIKNRYLDLDGLKRYDGLIKSLISSGNKVLADAINALNAKIGNLDIEGSDDKSFAEAINDIYASIADIVATQDELGEKDTELEGKINNIIGDLDSLEGSDGVMTLVDISNNLKKLGASVAKNTEDIEKLNGEGEGSVKKIAADAAAQALADAKADAAEKYQEKGNYETAGAADAALAAAKVYADGLVKDAEGNVKFDEAGAADAALADAKNYADSLATNYDAAGAAAQALADAKADAAEKYQEKGDYDAAGTAAGLNDAMDVRVKALEAIDHDKIAADAVAAVVAGADSDFDTLKEVADWIAADKEGSAALQTTVSDHTTAINTINGDIDALELKVNTDIANLTSHMTEASAALAEVDGRLDVLEAFEETHESIPDTDIDSLFA